MAGRGRLSTSPTGFNPAGGGFGSFGGSLGGARGRGAGGGGGSEAELNKVLQALALILKERAGEPSFVDASGLLGAAFPQPPASSFRPSPGQFGQNAASFSNVSQVPSKGDRRIANTGSAIINIIRAIQARKKKEANGGSDRPRRLDFPGGIG